MESTSTSSGDRFGTSQCNIKPLPWHRRLGGRIHCGGGDEVGWQHSFEMPYHGNDRRTAPWRGREVHRGWHGLDPPVPKPTMCGGRLHSRHPYITKLRLWLLSDFKKKCDYLSKEQWADVKKWEKELAGRKAAPPPRTTNRGRRKPGGDRGKGDGADKAPAKTPRTGKGATSGLTPAMQLSKKLEGAKKKRRREEEEVDHPGASGSGEEQKKDSPEIASSAEDSELNTGALVDATAPGRRVLGKDALVKAASHRDTKGDTTKNWSNQLTNKAVALAAQRKKDKKKRKSKGDSTKKMANALMKILTSSGSGKKKDKKQSKKKHRRRKLKDGTIVSCSSSSNSSSEVDVEEKASSDSDMEAPLKKRSRDSPGSVLALLTTHVREQMEQGALTELPEGGGSVTGGVKIATYFALQVKPNFPHHLRELREMHSLAATMDLLRKGDVARVGDSLAVYMALHQSMIDQNWSTARHMELHSMEDSAAGNAAIILASRKHSRLVEKVQGRGPSGWSGWSGQGRGKGKGNWKGQNEWTPNQKGAKGQGKEKGRKGKGTKNQWDQKVADWEKNKDKGDDK